MNYHRSAKMTASNGTTYDLQVQNCGKAIGVYPKGQTWMNAEAILEVPVSNHSRGITEYDIDVARVAIDRIDQNRNQISPSDADLKISRGALEDPEARAARIAQNHTNLQTRRQLSELFNDLIDKAYPIAA